jgi:hypothetical protein
MSLKINELVQTLGSGARTNKYRIIIPILGRELDIQCHSVTSPGKTIGTTEVFLRGRKFLIAGDRADEGTIQFSFYNDESLLLRNFFLASIDSLQSYETPITIDVTAAQNLATSLLDVAGATIGAETFGRLKEVVSEVQSNLNSLATLMNYGTAGGLTDWYMSDVYIQQLDSDGNIVSEMILNSAFVSEVSEIEYTDETGEISKTNVTLTYTGSSIN